MMVLQRLAQWSQSMDRLRCVLTITPWRQTYFQGYRYKTKAAVSSTPSQPPKKRKKYKKNPIAEIEANVKVKENSLRYVDSQTSSDNKKRADPVAESTGSEHFWYNESELETNNAHIKKDTEPAVKTEKFYKYDEEEVRNITNHIKTLQKLLVDIKGNGRRLCLVDVKAAERLVGHVKKDLKEDDIILDASPSLGITTEAFLSRTRNTVFAYEPIEPLKQYLKENLSSRYSALQVHKFNVHKFYGYHIVTCHEPHTELIQKFLKPLLVKTEANPPNLKIVGVSTSKELFTKWVLSFVFQFAFYEKTNPILYFYISTGVLNILTLSGKINKFQQNLGEQFQFCFNLEELDSVPHEGFFPKITGAGRKKRDGNTMRLVKIWHKEDIYKQVSREELPFLFCFMHMMLRSKQSDTIIDIFDRWIPNSAPHFIKLGMPVFTQPKTKSREQLIEAFQMLTSHPSYHASIFQHHTKDLARRLTGLEI